MLRLVGFLEGLSFLVLLGIAMPLKYAYGMPLAVRIAGITHGILFIAFLYLLMQAGLPRRRVIEGVVAAVLPFGTFWFDRRIRGIQ